jgi:cytochrome P450
MSITHVEYDPFSGEMHADPYPTYRWLREHAPVYHNAERDLWVVSRHEDVAAIASDPETYSSAGGADVDNIGAHFTASGNFLDSDPPLHGKLRGVLHPHFMPKTMRPRMEPIVRAAVADLLDELAERDVVDFAEDFAWVLPVRVTAKLLGLPKEDLALMRRWSQEVPRRIAGVPEPPPPARRALAEVIEYLQGKVDERRGAPPSEELLSVIASATVDDALIAKQAAGIATLVFLGGVETSASMIGNALLLLAQHPEQRAYLAQNPTAIPDAIEEILRFDCPAQHARRLTTREVELHGTLIPRGSYVVILFGSANRDERRYEHAERFDVRREHKRALAFGNGIHHCIGAPLARLQGAAMLEAVLRELPDYELAGPVERFCSHLDRGIESLPLRQNRRASG